MNSKKIEKAISEIGERVKKRRLEMDLTQAELAKLAGLTKTTVVQIEIGDAKPSQIILFKLSRVFKVTIDELVYGDI
ncbi:helix-turn-helix transcriptional regulator [Clostridium baratii]|uniref:helix-turn-helix transcriptional regulator n=1 Tax=Clostridium baratii TaxID=1561 RepID=UPI0030CD8452